MRSFAYAAAAGLLLASVATLAAGETKASKKGATCGDYGTTINFVDSPKEAAKLAEKEEKLVLVLHISGHFEDPGLT